MAAVDAEKITEPPTPPASQFMDHSPSRRASDAALDSSSVSDGPDRPSLERSLSSRSPSRSSDAQIQQALRSEEYRQLFRLPPDEVLIQDFNCALQENFLLQGHMYLFDHYICFYSNLFGFETKKIIPFHEVTSVRRAKAAVLFPTAIEIIAGEKKFFFASFLSRDEAFKLISDGWVQHSSVDAEIINQQEEKSEASIQENGSVAVERTLSSGESVDAMDLIERDRTISTSEDLNIQANGEPEIVAIPLSDSVEEDRRLDQSTVSSSKGECLSWEQEESGAPPVPECYMKVAQSKFPIKVETFFHLFFSDEGVNFQESFHRKCGDKDFKCTSWRPHEKFGHIRDVSFQHPIKLYLGAKFGSCNEVQKYRVYQNSHLIVETSQEITDVPYGDYFCVEGLWDVERDGDELSESCSLKVFINVAFSKKTIFKGKIVQSTIEECRDAYAAWIELAHETLKQKNLEREHAGGSPASLSQNGRDDFKNQPESEAHTESSKEETRLNCLRPFVDSKNVNQQVTDSNPGSFGSFASVASHFRNYMMKFSSLKGQSQFSLLLGITIVLILLLMQISILVLLSRPQQIHMITQVDSTSSLRREGDTVAETVALLDKQINHMKEEMNMVEILLEKMKQEHALLKVKLQDLEMLRRRQKR